MYKKYFFVLITWYLFVFESQAQKLETSHGYAIDVNYFYGSLLRHSKDIAHLVNGHPEGFELSFSRQTFGANHWERTFNYPDYGASFVYHAGKDQRLGDTYGLYGHYNFYFFNRHLTFKIGQGIAYATNPFDLESNFKNNAYGTRLLAGTFLKLNYNIQLSQHWSSQIGMQLLHFSNGNLKAPNSSTNTFAFSLGLRYDSVADKEKIYASIGEQELFGRHPIRFEFQLKGGVNESDFVGLGQHPFFVFTAMAQKRLSSMSSVQLGAEYFHATFLKKEIDFLEVAFPNRVNEQNDFRRVGIFAGYALHINRMSVFGQLGYYVYYPYDFDGRFYQRLGLAYELTDSWYGLAAIKSHGAKAEAIEFGVGFKI